MKYLLDTNVVSELRKGERADRGVRTWFDGVLRPTISRSRSSCLGEIRLGILRLRAAGDPSSADHLATWLTRVEQTYEGRTLAVDERVAETWAKLNQSRSLPSSIASSGRAQRPACRTGGGSAPLLRFVIRTSSYPMISFTSSPAKAEVESLVAPSIWRAKS